MQKKSIFEQELSIFKFLLLNFTLSFVFLIFNLTNILFPDFHKRYVVCFYSALIYPLYFFSKKYLFPIVKEKINKRKINKEKFNVLHNEKQQLMTEFSKMKKIHEITLNKLSKLQNALDIQKQHTSNEQQISKQLRREKSELLQDQETLKIECATLKEKNYALHEKCIILEQRLSMEKKQFCQMSYENAHLLDRERNLDDHTRKLDKKIESLLQINTLLKQTHQRWIHEKAKLTGEIVELKKAIETCKIMQSQNIESFKFNQEKIKSFLFDLHYRQKSFSTHIYTVLDINERKIEKLTKKLNETQQFYLDLFIHLNKQLETAVEKFSSCKESHITKIPIEKLQHNIIQHVIPLIGSIEKLTVELNDMKAKKERRDQSLSRLASTCTISRKKLKLTTPGCCWIIKKKHSNELDFLLSNDTIAVGSFIVYLLCRQYSIPTTGFDEADIDLITRLKPAAWQAYYENIGVQVIKFWNRNGITACKALFRQRKVDIVFVELDSSIDWITWLNHDVYSRPDNSLSVFYCMKYNDTIVAYDPSGKGMLSLLTNSIHILGNTEHTIQESLLACPARILRLANSAAKFGLTIEHHTFNAIENFASQRELATQMRDGWLLAKHKKYSSLITGKSYRHILSKLDPKNTLFPTSYFTVHSSPNRIDEISNENQSSSSVMKEQVSKSISGHVEEPPKVLNLI